MGIFLSYQLQDLSPTEGPQFGSLSIGHRGISIKGVLSATVYYESFTIPATYQIGDYAVTI